MNRFIYYMILVNMLANMVTIAPRALLAADTKGALTAIFLSIIVGIPVTYLIVLAFSYFPKKDLPYIFKTYTPKWIAMPMLLFFSFFWFIAGLITLTVYTFIILRYLTPEMNIYTIVLTFVAIVTFGIFMKSIRILYTTEIVAMLFLPIILYIMIKSFLGPNINWEFIKIAFTYINHLPNYNAFSVCFYLIIGAANLAVFNVCFPNLKKPTLKSMAILTGFTTIILMSIFLIPIGYGGIEIQENVVYPWINASDAIRMRYGFVERIVFFFLASFLAMAVMSIVIQWHVSIHLLTSVFHLKHFTWKSFNLIKPLFIVLFWIVAITAIKLLTVGQLFRWTQLYDNSLPFVTALFLGTLWLAKKKKGGSSHAKTK